MKRKYLLATDGSEDSMRAAYFLLDLVRDSGEFEITVLHAVNVKKEIYNSPLLKDIPEIERVIKEQAGQLLNDVAEVFENEGIQVNRVVLDGDPGREIAEYARLYNVNQIIMGSRGLGNIKGMVLGSVSQKVIYLSTTPVTLVKYRVE